MKSLQTNGRSVRKASRQHGISNYTFPRAIQSNSVDILGRGRGTTFTVPEEQVLIRSILEFSRNGTPLSKESVKDFLALFSA